MATVSDLNDFLDMSVEQLKYYLQQRGQTYSGTHASLAARALLAQEQGISIVPIADDIAKQLKSDYNAILSNHQLITDPFMESGWVDDVTLFPLTNIGQVFSYILSAKAFSTEYIGQYKVRKAFSFFMSGFVDKILVLPLQNGRSLIKTNVLPSQRLNDDKHNVWILFSDIGDVLTACCTCTAGLCRCCNHVVAALYKIEYANEKGLTKPTCTEIPCAWNSSNKNPQPMKIKDMQFWKHNASKQPKHMINTAEK